jgi:hypothetical protein
VPLVPPPTSYCTAGTTSNGCNARVSASGLPSRSSSSGFALRVDGVEGAHAGALFMGFEPAAVPWGQGSSFACIGAPTPRLAMLESGGVAGTCTGVFALDFNTWMATHPATAPAAGALVCVQAWFRDPPSPKATSLSDALRFFVAP